jgi:hypothetical protein
MLLFYSERRTSDARRRPMIVSVGIMHWLAMALAARVL